jgi:hypothetical protein
MLNSYKPNALREPSLRCRTTLINGSFGFRNISFGDGLLNSIVILINGVETIQVALGFLKKVKK